AEAVRVLSNCRWPGNIRELQNCVERSILSARDSVIDVADLPPYLFDQTGGGADGPSFPMMIDAEIEEFERRQVLSALKQTSGVQVRAAELLGISERSLWHRIKKLRINVS